MKERVIHPQILNLGIRKMCPVSFSPRPLYFQGSPGIHCIGGWVVPRVGLEAVEKGKSLFPTENRIPIPQHSSPPYVATQTQTELSFRRKEPNYGYDLLEY
jgi:hypothetical protein